MTEAEAKTEQQQNIEKNKIEEKVQEISQDLQQENIDQNNNNVEEIQKEQLQEQKLKQQEENQVENKEETKEIQKENLEKSNEVIIEEEKKKEPLKAKSYPELAGEKIQEAEKIKEQAKPFVQQKNYQQAATLYQQALHILDPHFFKLVQDEKKLEEFLALNNILLNNLALMYYNLKNYAVAIQFSGQVLLTDPNNVKAHYRQAMCYKIQEDHERAFQCIKKCVQLNNVATKKLNQNDINTEYNSIKATYKKYLDDNRSKEREVYSKMLNSTVKSQTETSQKFVQNIENQQKNMNFSQSVFGNIQYVKNDKKTLICLLGSSIAGVTLPLCLGVEMKDVKGISGTVGLIASYFGLSRIDGIQYRSLFLASSAAFMTLLYKLSPKAIKN